MQFSILDVQNRNIPHPLQTTKLGINKLSNKRALLFGTWWYQKHFFKRLYLAFSLEKLDINWGHRYKKHQKEINFFEKYRGFGLKVYAVVTNIFQKDGKDLSQSVGAVV